MMKRDLILRVAMTLEEAAMYEGRSALVLPLSDAEQEFIRDDLQNLKLFLDYSEKCLETLRRAAEAKSASPELVESTALMLIGSTRTGREMLTRLASLIVRGFIVGQADQDKGAMQ